MTRPRARKFSQLFQARKTVAFDFSHHGQALVTLYVQFLCSDWSTFDRWVHAENLCSILNLVYFDSWSWQSFCQLVVFLTVFLHWMCKWNSAAIRSPLLLGFWLRNTSLVKVGNPISDGIVFVLLQSLKRYWLFWIPFRSCILNGKREK